MICKLLKKLILLGFVFFLSAFFVNADVEFNGTVLDTNGLPLANSTINLTVRSMQGWSIIGYNSTTSNGSGWFNMTLHQTGDAQIQQWIYEPVITHVNTSFNYTDYRSKTIPAFPGMMMQMLAGTNFYLTAS